MSSYYFMPRRIRLLDDPHRVVDLTSRTLHGRYLMPPGEKVNARILGVVGRAQRLYKIQLHAFIFMSNHKHIMATAPSVEHMARFEGYLKANIAKELGRLHNWKEKFWGRRYQSISINFTEHDLEKRFLYILENGCKEGLVDSPLDWPGVTSARALYDGQWTIPCNWYDRTAQYRASQRGVDEEVLIKETVRLTPLPFLQERSPEEQRAYYVNAVRDIERKTKEMHQKNGTSSMGARAIRRLKPYSKPKAFKATPAPLFHAANRRSTWIFGRCTTRVRPKRPFIATLPDV